MKVLLTHPVYPYFVTPKHPDVLLGVGVVSALISSSHKKKKEGREGKD